MTGRVLGAAVLAGLAVAVVTLPAGAGPAARLRGLPERHGQGSPPAAPPVASSARRLLRLLAAVLAGSGVAAVVPVPAGPVLAVAAGVAVLVLLPRLAPRAGSGRTLPAADVPPVLDLLASCLAAGAPLATALAVVGEAVPPPLGPSLRGAATALLLGSPPETALARLDGPPELRRLGEVLARAAASGAPPVEEVAALAEDARLRARDAGRAAARRAGVLVVLPLGLCFLPAFVLLGVVPVVAGVAGQVLP